MKQIEDNEGNTAELADLGGGRTELAVTADDACISLVLTPRQLRALARQMLQAADEQEGEDEG